MQTEQNHKKSVEQGGGQTVAEVHGQETGKKKTRKPLPKKVLLGGAGVVFLLLFIFALPLGAKYYVIDWLQKHGAEQAVIDRLGWNPFQGKFWINGVNLIHKGKTVMKQERLDINVDYTSLFSKDVVLSSLRYTGLSIDIEQTSDGGWQIATFTIPAAAEKEEKTTLPEKAGDTTVQTRQQVRDAWAFLADDVVLTDCEIHYKTPVLDVVVDVESAELERFSTRQGSPAGNLVLKGSINGEPVSIDLHQVEILPTLRLEGKVGINRFDLDTLDALLHDALPFFGGSASLDGEVKFSFGDSGMDIKYSGSLGIAKADAGSASFRTRAENLGWQGTIHYRMPTDAPMEVITEGTLQGDGYRLQLPSSEMHTSEEQIQLTGTTRVTIGDNVQVEHNGKLAVKAVSLGLPALRTTEDSLLWDGHVRYDSAKAHRVKTKGKLVITAMDYNMPTQHLQLREEQIKWQGSIRYQGRNGRNNNDIRLEGELGLAPVSFEHGKTEEKVTALLKSLGWKGVVSFFQPDDGGSQVSADGTLSGEEAEVTMHGKHLSFTEKDVSLAATMELHLGDELHIQGDTSLQAGAFALQQLGKKDPVLTLSTLAVSKIKGLGGKKIAVEGVAAADLGLRVDGGFPLNVTVSAIELGNFFTSDLENFTLDSLALKSPELVSLHNGKDLLSLDDILCSGLKADLSGSASAASVSLNNLLFLEDGNKQGAALNQAELKGIRWSGKDGITAADIALDTLSTTIIRTSDGAIHLASQLAAMQKNSGAEKTKEKQPKEVTAATGPMPVTIKLDKVRILRDSLIEFKDHTLKEPYQTSLVIDQFQITNLNSAKPDHKSPFRLSGTLEGRAPVKIEGDIWPFQKDIGIDLSLALRNYPLRNLSPYLTEGAGVGLAGGELKLNSSVLLKKGYLKNTNEFLLEQLETNMVSDELNKRLPIPLDTALSVLRDNNGNIKLSVPLSGELDKLHVGLADIIVTALEKAVVPALTGYAVYALGPYGALAYAGIKLGEDLLKEKDLPVIFVKREVTLVAQQKKLIDPIGKRMQAETKEDMRICPIVASWEMMDKEQINAVSGRVVPVSPDMRQQLDELGQSRARNIQNYLARNYGIEKDRLLLCTTVIREEKKMLPLVILRK
ncbi:MAG: hypothetical protein CSA32_03995 [Desulfobulbus propionicus]|nr:MAG: hypothetical protein CSA32_03995 [Desulfobulbus propionicus]